MVPCESSFAWKAMLTLDSQILDLYWFRHTKRSHNILINHSLLSLSLSLSLKHTQRRTRTYTDVTYLSCCSSLQLQTHLVLKEIHWKKPFFSHTCVCIEEHPGYFLLLNLLIISKGVVHCCPTFLFFCLGFSPFNLQMRRYTATRALFLLQLFFFFAYVLSASDVITAPMEKIEQEALYSVTQGFVGDWWNGSALYPDPCGWTPMQGVSCDLFEGLWYVTVLNIGPVFDNSLECSQDAISPYVFELRHLRSLSFFNCFSSSARQPATIPSQNWQKLAGDLETLEFRSNRGLTGAIPAGLGLLINLQSLALVENSLTGDLLPSELGNLVLLRRLSLARNRLSGPIPTSLGNNLADLLILDLSVNSLAGALPPSLGNMNSLLKPDLSYNHLNGKLPGELEKLKNLNLLDLSNNNLSGGLSEVASLQGMASLQDLLLSNNPMGGNLMEFRWENMRNLTTLNLSNMSLTGEIPESIRELRKLRYLDPSSNHLSGSVSPKFAALPCLCALYLNGNNLTGALGFFAEFYERMGRRFVSWDNNPSLCCNVGMKPQGHVPVGVARCKHQDEVPISDLDSRNKLSDKNPNQKSSFMASFGLSTSSIAGFWWVLLMQEVVAAFLLLILE